MEINKSKISPSMFELLDTLDAIAKQEKGEELINTLNIITNLMHELGNKRKTSAVYTRCFKHDILSVTVNYRDYVKWNIH